MIIKKDYLTLHFIVLIWGFTTILGLLIHVPAVEIVFFRTLLSFASLGILLYIRKKNFLIGGAEVLKLLGTGFLVSAHWILFFASARVSNASVCLAGIATCALWTSFLEPLMTRKRIKPYEVVLGSFVIVGLYVIFNFEFNHALGLFMAVLSAFIGAIFMILNGKFSVKHDHYLITFYEMIGACLGTALFFPVYLKYFADGLLQLDPGLMDWLYLLVLAVICTVYAFSVSVELMKRLSAFTINLTVNLEPVYGILLAFIIFGDKEKMTAGFYVGTLIILLSVLLYPVMKRITEKRKKLAYKV